MLSIVESAFQKRYVRPLRVDLRLWQADRVSRELPWAGQLLAGGVWKAAAVVVAFDFFDRHPIAGPVSCWRLFV